MMQKPQIIVIPQHLLSEQSKNFLRQRQVLPNTSTNKPIAAVMGSQRPIPAISPELKPLLKRPLSPVVSSEVKTEIVDDQPARKRANLDHLSPEERMMRRKLKNRVAAQTARDKKKAYIDEIEAVLQNLRDEHKQTLAENARLLEANSTLQLENASLQQHNKELLARLGQLDTDAHTDFIPMSPESLPRSPSPPCTTTTSTPALSSPEPAALAPLPQESDDKCRQRKVNPGLSSRDLTTWLINYVAQMLMWSVMLPPPLLPIKKNCVSSAPTSLSISPTSISSVPTKSWAEIPPPAPNIRQTSNRLPPKKRTIWSEKEALLVAPPLG